MSSKTTARMRCGLPVTAAILSLGLLAILPAAADVRDAGPATAGSAPAERPEVATPDPDRAATPGLDEDAAARFIASIAPMRRLGRAIAARAALVETNPDDPLMPYAHLSPEQLEGEADLKILLNRYGFLDIADWLAVGEPLMQAYYHVSRGERNEDWERQVMQVLAEIQGLDAMDPAERAARIARLLADLRARRDAALPAEHIEIARKFRRSLELATDGTIK